MLGLGRGLITKAAAASAVAACIFVAIVCLAVAIYHALTLVLLPAGAAAVTGLLFAAAAGVCGLIFFRKEEPDPEEDESFGLQDRVVGLFRTRPILGTVAGLAAGWIFLRNPALATMVAAAFTEKARGSGRPRR